MKLSFAQRRPELPCQRADDPLYQLIDLFMGERRSRSAKVQGDGDALAPFGKRIADVDVEDPGRLQEIVSNLSHQPQDLACRHALLYDHRDVPVRRRMAREGTEDALVRGGGEEGVEIHLGHLDAPTFDLEGRRDLRMELA
jgi:hypothetical protein